MGKEIVTQIQEVPRIPGRINPRRNTVIKLTKIKDKEKILKATNNIQRNSQKILANFPAENLQARSGWHNVIK